MYIYIERERVREILQYVLHSTNLSMRPYKPSNLVFFGHWDSPMMCIQIPIVFEGFHSCSKGTPKSSIFISSSTKIISSYEVLKTTNHPAMPILPWLKKLWKPPHLLIFAQDLPLRNPPWWLRSSPQHPQELPGGAPRISVVNFSRSNSPSVKTCTIWGLTR